MIDYNQKRFKPISVTENGEVSQEIIFKYIQEGNVLSCSYSGGDIVKGNLIGKVASSGEINMRYMQINKKGEINTGKCKSTLEIQANGKYKLFESWEWTSGDFSKGNSVLEEI